MPRRLFNLILHAFAIGAPMYAIYLPILHDEPRSEIAPALWRSIGVGAVLYAVAGIAWLLLHR